MLSIIPIEVIIRMPRIYQFLLKQSFSEIKVNTTEEGDQKKTAKGKSHGRQKKGLSQGDQDEYDW